MHSIYNSLTPVSTAPARDLVVQPLRDGEMLAREEFERRYAAMPEVKAELIEGVVVVSSLLTADHAVPHAKLSAWLGVYSAATPGILVLDNVSYRVDPHNEFQPDLVLMLAPERGGRARIDPYGYLIGTPELVVEVAASSAARDLSQKFAVYRRAGVQEYCVWQARERAVSWWVLVEEEYVALSPDDEGVWRSAAFPGLWLDALAMARGDLRAVLERLQAGLCFAEHAEFITR